MRNIILIGYRGTGKTTLARNLASRLGWAWADSDLEVEKNAGKSIREIFEDDGEPCFRDWEGRAIADLANRLECVVATGGGAVIRPENRQMIRRSDHVIWLRAKPETILDRIRADHTSVSRRPNLTSHGGLEEIRSLLFQREPWYQECATTSVNTDSRTLTEIADEIYAQIIAG
jgi:shikimate kinase